MNTKPPANDPSDALLAIAAALSQVAHELAMLRERLPDYGMWCQLIENLRSDHPRQGETLGEVVNALFHIAWAVEDAAGKDADE
jgi:hypothetical protein